MPTLEKILLDFDPREENLLPVLRETSRTFSFVSEKDARKIASYFNLPFSRVYETASFFDLLETKKTSLLRVEICSGGNCCVKNCFSVLEAAENSLGVKEGDEFNPKISLKLISCLGRCAEGPIMKVNGKIFEKMTPAGVYSVLREYL